MLLSVVDSNNALGFLQPSCRGPRRWNALKTEANSTSTALATLTPQPIAHTAAIAAPFAGSVDDESAPSQRRPMSDRRFTDDEVGRVLARAADLSATNPQKTTSLDDIERIAAEAGIDPALVRKAAEGLAAPPAKTQPTTPVRTTTASNENPSGLFGPSRLVFEAVFDGELDESLHPALRTGVLEGTSFPLAAVAVGRALHFQRSSDAEHGYGTEGGPLRISIMPRGGKTVLRVEDRLGGLMGGIWGGVGGGAGLSFAFLMLGFGVSVGGDWGAIAGLFGGLATAYGATRALFITIARAREVRTKDLFEQLSTVVASTLASASSLSSARERVGLLAAPENEAVPQDL